MAVDEAADVATLDALPSLDACTVDAVGAVLVRELAAAVAADDEGGVVHAPAGGEELVHVRHHGAVAQQVAKGQAVRLVPLQHPPHLEEGPRLVPARAARVSVAAAVGVLGVPAGVDRGVARGHLLGRERVLDDDVWAQQGVSPAWALRLGDAGWSGVWDVLGSAQP